MKMHLIIAAVVTATLLPFYQMSAEESLESVGRMVFEKYADSVLFIAITVEIQMSVGDKNQTTEGAVEVLGTLVQDDGLMVVSNSAIDLARQVRAQLRSQVPAEMQVSAETSVKDAKIVLPDGVEIDAEVVLQDADLDIAFIRPIATGDDNEADDNTAFTPPPFADDAPRLQMLDDIIVLGRLGKNLNRTPTVQVGQIELVVRRPRLLYRSNLGGLAQPVFNAEGNLAGLFLRQTSTDPEDGSSIIRPVKDILKSATRSGLIEIAPE